MVHCTTDNADGSSVAHVQWLGEDGLVFGTIPTDWVADFIDEATGPDRSYEVHWEKKDLMWRPDMAPYRVIMDNGIISTPTSWRVLVRSIDEAPPHSVGYEWEPAPCLMSPTDMLALTAAHMTVEIIETDDEADE